MHLFDPKIAALANLGDQTDILYEIVGVETTNQSSHSASRHAGKSVRRANTPNAGDADARTRDISP
jgi:hypothetical protein